MAYVPFTGVEEPKEEKGFFQKLKEASQDVNLDAPKEDFISSQPDGEIATALTNYGTGAIQGAQEQYRQEQNLRSIANVDEFGNASPKEGVDQQQVTDQQALVTKAQSTFADETIKPPLLPLAMAGTAASKTVAGILYAPFMVKDIQHSYSEAGGGVAGAGQAARDLTYGGAVDFMNQSDLGEQFANKPITTTVNGILSLAPPFIMGKGLYKGAMNLKSGFKPFEGVKADDSIVNASSTESREYKQMEISPETSDYLGVEQDTKVAANAFGEVLRNEFGIDPVITSGKRTPEVNAEAKGSPTSFHLKGKAIDLSVGNISEEKQAIIKQKALEAGWGEVLYHDAGNGFHLHLADFKGDISRNRSSVGGFESFVNAISGQESGGNYSAVNERTGASGKFQIMPENWEPWAREAGLPEGSEMTPANQEVVARFKLRQYYDKYGPRGAAEAWYGGEGAISYSDAAKIRKQGNGNEPSINEYADSIINRMGKNPIEETKVNQINIKERRRLADEENAKVDKMVNDAINSVKEPWEMTADELTQNHRQIVEKAVDDGKSVPEEVLKQYPDLIEKSRGRMNSDDSIIDKGPVRITSIRGDDVPVGPTFEETRKNVRAWAIENIRGSYENPDIGLVDVPSNGIRHTINSAREISHLQAVAAIPDLLKNAVKVDTRPDYRGRNDVKSVHTLYAPLEIGDKKYVSKIVVNETKDGHKFYDHQASQIEKLDGDNRGPQAKGSLGVSPASSSTINIRDLLQHVKEEHKPPSMRNTGIEYSRTAPPNNGGSSMSEARQTPNQNGETVTRRTGIVGSLVDQDLSPAAKTAIQAINEGAQDLRNSLSPVSAGESAKITGGVMRDNLGGMAQKGDRAEKSMNAAREFFSKQLPEDNLAFIHNIETGQGQVTPKLQEFADIMRGALDSRRQEIQNLGTGKLQKFIENYFPHVWKDPKQGESFIGSWLGKRPFEGKKSFLKQRSLPTTMDGIQAGLEPISYNPVDLAMLKMREMDKYIMAHKTLNELKSKGLVQAVKATSGEKPDGWVQIDDRIGTIYGSSEITVREAFDRQMMDSLNRTAENLGIIHERAVHMGLGSDGAGVWGYTGENMPGIVTKFGGPESVVAHEIGHQLAYKYNLDDLFRNDQTPIKVGKGRSQSTTAGAEMARELDMLADKRMDPNSMSEAEQAYVRGRTEPIAAVVEAYVHAPELFKETAPLVYEKFVKFLDEHPELHELRDIEPSLEIGEGEGKQRIDGLVIKEHYYMPAEAARLINNYLSPGLRDKSGAFRGYLGIANVMNQFQLGLSAFHLGFTSMDATVSKVALGLVKISHGDVIEGLSDFAHAPIAPVENALRGNKVLEEWLKPGSQGAEIVKIVDALVAGGGRVQMDKFYKTGAWQGMKDAVNQGNYLGGIARIPFAIMEKATHPIMEYIVPRQKLGIFADLARYEMERNPNMTRDELRYTMGKIWNSVDNRMGQMVYDNLFWNKTLKDLTMASVRSVGWNLGTFRELGGAITDTAEQGYKLAKGEKAELTYKMSYGLALPITVGLMGAITQYLYTGLAPQDMKDLFFPRTGTLDKNGRAQRIELPSYMKDVYAYWEHPGTTLTNKLHPMIAAISYMFKNKDYYGTKIYNEDDALKDKIGDIGKFAMKSFIPFAIQGAIKQHELGTSLKDIAQPFIGVTPAPSDVNKTSVEKKMSELIKARMPLGSKTKEQAKKSELRSNILRDMQMNGGKTTQSLTDALRSKLITQEEANRLKTDAKLSPLERSAKRLDITDLQSLLPKAEPQEKPVLEKVLKEKIKNAKSKGIAVK